MVSWQLRECFEKKKVADNDIGTKSSVIRTNEYPFNSVARNLLEILAKTISQDTGSKSQIARG